MTQILDPRLGPLAKHELQYIYPAGTTGGDNPQLRGAPDSLLLNRNEWYEMLYFCNKFTIQNSIHRDINSLKAYAKKAEKLIKQWVPSHLHDRTHIENWLIINWDYYQ